MTTDDTPTEQFPGLRRAFADEVRAQRLAATLTQDDVAERLTMSLVTYIRLERAQRDMSVPQFWDIAAAIGVDPVTLWVAAVDRWERAGDQQPERTTMRVRGGRVWGAPDDES